MTELAGEAGHQLDADSERSAGGVAGAGGAGVAATNSNCNQLPASPASLSVSPSVAALSITQGSASVVGSSMVTSKSVAAVERGGGEAAYLSQLTHFGRTSIARANANSFERARTIDHQEAGSNGKPIDGSFEFSAKIKNSTSTELNE